MTTAQDQALGFTLLTNLLVSSVVVLVYFVLWALFPHAFRTYDNYGRDLDELLLMPFWKRVMVMIKLDPDIIVRTRSLDVFCYLRFLRLCVRIFACTSFLGLVYLIPINAVAGTNRVADVGLEATTMTNIESGDDILWAHLVSGLLNSAIVCYVWYQEFKLYNRLRLKYRNSDRPRNHTVLLTDIPNGSKHEVATMMRKVHEDILDVQLVPPSKKLGKLLKKRNALILKHSRAIQSVNNSSLDNVLKMRASVKAIDINISEIRDAWFKRMNSEKKPSRSISAFVTYKNHASALMCSQIRIGNTGSKWKIQSASDPADVIWTHLTTSKRSRLVRGIISKVVYFVFTCYGTLIVTFFSALSNIEKIMEDVGLSIVSDILDAVPIARTLIEGFLPPIMVILFASIAPTVMYMLSNLEGTHHTHTDIERATLHKLHLFLLANVLLVSAVGSAFLSKLSDIIDAPRDTLVEVTEAFTANASFFANYFLNSTINSNFMRLLYIGTRLKVILMTLIHANPKHRRDRQLVQRPSPCMYGELYARHLLFVAMGLMFSTISPVLNVFALFYFIIAFGVDATSLVYNRRNFYDGGGIHFADAFYWCMVGLVVYQLTIVGSLSAKDQFIASGVAFLMVIATLRFTFYVKHKFISVAVNMPVQAMGDDNPEFLPIVRAEPNDYLHPLYKFNHRNDAEQWGFGYPLWHARANDENFLNPQSNKEVKALFQEKVLSGAVDSDTGVIQVPTNMAGKPNLFKPVTRMDDFHLPKVDPTVDYSQEKGKGGFFEHQVGFVKKKAELAQKTGLRVVGLGNANTQKSAYLDFDEEGNSGKSKGGVLAQAKKRMEMLKEVTDGDHGLIKKVDGMRQKLGDNVTKIVGGDGVEDEEAEVAPASRPTNIIGMGKARLNQERAKVGKQLAMVNRKVDAATKAITREVSVSDEEDYYLPSPPKINQGDSKKNFA